MNRTCQLSTIKLFKTNTNTLVETRDQAILCLTRVSDGSFPAKKENTVLF